MVDSQGAEPDLFSRLDGVVSRVLHRLSGVSCGTGAEARTGPGAEAGDLGFGAEDTVSRERALLAAVDTYLARGRDLKRWWESVSPSRSFRERFDLARTFNESAESFGFFDVATVSGDPMPVMGNFQEMYYDALKSPDVGRSASATWMCDQMREFVLRYFMRISDFQAPKGFADTWRPPLSITMSLLGWCPDDIDALRGFGFRQLWYKEKGGRRRVCRFPDEQAHSIIDLRELRESYEWIVVKVDIFDFDFAVAPFGASGPSLSLPLQESSYLVLTADLIQHEEAPVPGVLGRYGIGYAFVRNPHLGVLRYGPGEFEAAIELIQFHVLEDGSVRVPMVFVANRPRRILQLDLDPMGTAVETGLRLIDLASLGMASGLVNAASRVFHGLPRPRLGGDPLLGYVTLANLVSDGMAADYLCIDRRQLEKDFLVKHYMQHYQAIAGSLATWRLVVDWCDQDSLPRWVREGRRP